MESLQTKTSKSKSEAGFSIGVTCPGCGGDLELGEDFYVLTCDHCASVLRLILPERPTAFLVLGRLSQAEVRFAVDRHLKENNLPLTGAGLQVKNIYYPFWKVAAILLKVRNRKERRVVYSGSESENADYVEREKSETSVTSYAATAAAGPVVPGIPISIGIRAQFIKMYPFSEEVAQDDFDVIPIMRSAEDVLKTTIQKFVSYGEKTMDAVGINRTEILEPQFSLVYFPFHIVEGYGNGYRRYLVDGVTGRVLHQNDPNQVTMMESEGTSTDETAPAPVAMSEFGSLRVDLHRCSNCGEDLPSHESHAYLCRNCHRLQLVESFKLPLTGVYEATTDANNKDVCFPFWSFKLRAGDGATRSVFAGLMSSDQVVVPAFRFANFESYYRLSQKMSSAAPRIDREELLEFRDRHRAVEIGPVRAMAMAKGMLYRQMLSRNQHSELDDVKFDPIETSLIFVPFHPESYFYVDSVMNAITFEKVHSPN